jgi:hypothetical protein
MVCQLVVENLFRSRDMKRIESGCSHKGLSNDPGPDVPESEETNPRFGADGLSNNFMAVLELGEYSTVEVEVEVKHRRMQLAIGSGSDCSIDQATNRNRQLAGDSEEQRELIVGVGTWHRDNDLLGISTVGLPHGFEMSMGEIGRSQIAGEGATKRSSSEILPEPAVKAPGIETRAGFRIETHCELSTVD